MGLVPDGRFGVVPFSVLLRSRGVSKMEKVGIPITMTVTDNRDQFSPSMLNSKRGMFAFRVGLRLIWEATECENNELLIQAFRGWSHPDVVILLIRPHCSQKRRFQWKSSKRWWRHIFPVNLKQRYSGKQSESSCKFGTY